MKKALLSNIKHFVDSNVRHRIDRATASSSQFIDEDLQLVERKFEQLRDFCVQAEKRISSLLLSLGSSASLSAYTQNLQASLTNLSSLASHQHFSIPGSGECLSGSVLTSRNTPNKSSANTPTTDTSITHHGNTTSSQHLFLSAHATGNTCAGTSATQSTEQPTSELSNISGNIHQHATATTNKQHKKLPIVGFFKFLVKSQYKLKQDSLLAIALSHCAQLQTQLTRLHLNYEQTIENECLKPLRNILENDLPNIVKLRRSLVRAHNELDSIRSKYNAACQKQQQFQTTHFTSNTYTVQNTTLQQANLQKLDQLKKEVEEAEVRFEQAKVSF